ncbi:hypothetical protein E3O55_06185 [Cryobacterium sp. MDB1-18-2]|uniref:hypothetical protein n=1 Tax=unclassified Cryobacterium TaxID=2649013 RepID=UPI00106A563E|nr:MULTISPECIES: hypothetical protein [unclassified Cryobacterium]TFC32126.1 hypothetical protein E3O55_06185 [Cryobacterium sp. MDB1-18-2]TFC39955.1 hypothetical protein E3O50_14825 [Cryobacterium sp. MDB1-18-1]
MAVYSETADLVEFCSFDDAGVDTRTPLAERTGHVFHGLIPGAGIGTRYGLRLHGPWNPANGLRHNALKVLLDPHVRAVEGAYAWAQEMFRHDQNNPEHLDPSDSAGFTPRCVITDPDLDWTGDSAPLTQLSNTVIYEVHVKGFTQTHPDVPDNIRGTYAGLSSPAALTHFTELGVTAMELMPVQQLVQDSHLEEKTPHTTTSYNDECPGPDPM